jgi:hypothetical protein
MKKWASHFTNKKCTSKNTRSSKRPPLKKEALRFMNEKHTIKNARGPKNL